MPQLTIPLDERTYGNLLGLCAQMGMSPEEAVSQAVTVVVNDYLLGLSMIGTEKEADFAFFTETLKAMALELEENPTAKEMARIAEQQFQERLKHM